MKYELIIPPGMGGELQQHLLTDRTYEQIAIALCGLQRRSTVVRLLARHLITLTADGLSEQSVSGIAVRPQVQQFVLQRAADEGLSQADFHTHPGDGGHIDFSGIDDRHEAALAAYLADRLPDTVYASVVMNNATAVGRVWQVRDDEVRAVPMAPPDLQADRLSVSGDRALSAAESARFDRQLNAFGRSFQQRLRALRVGIVGVGGLGSLIVEELTRLGVRDWVLVDDDIVEVSNLNRVVASTANDVVEEIAKVDVAARNIASIDQDAEVLAMRCTVYTERALRALSHCDVVIAATDDDASRLVVNALSTQYLIPIVHVGVHLSLADDGTFEDISGEVVVPPLGRWCLLCAGIVDANRAAQDLASPQQRALLEERGYLPGVPAPAVYHLNGVIASLAVAEVHNLVAPYRSPRPYLVYRELDGELLTIDVAATEDCLHCGPEGRLALGDLAPLWRPDRLAPPVLPPPLRQDGDDDAEVVDDQ